MPLAGFEAGIPASERPQTFALGRSAIGFGSVGSCQHVTRMSVPLYWPDVCAMITGVTFCVYDGRFKHVCSINFLYRAPFYCVTLCLLLQSRKATPFDNEVEGTSILLNV